MATYFVASGGSNTAPYDTWAKAATSLQTALTAASTAGDIVVIQYDGVPTGDAEGGGTDVTYTFASNCSLISASNDGGSAYTPTIMGDTHWIGGSHATSSRAITMAGAFAVYIYGVTLRTCGSGTRALGCIATTLASRFYESCTLWSGNTGGSPAIHLGANAAGSTSAYHASYRSCVFRVANTGSRIYIGGGSDIVVNNCSIHASSSIPSVGWISLVGTMNRAVFDGCDFSLGGTTMVAAATNLGATSIDFVNCKVPSSLTWLATQTPANLTSASVSVFNCASGDTHYDYGFYNALGSLVSVTGKYASGGAKYDGTNGVSWQIDTTAAASYLTPFITPWIDLYHSGTSAITPKLEILRDGSATAYDNDEVWGEFSYQGTSGSTKATIVDDRMAVGGTPAAQTTGDLGAGDWTGEGGTAWFGKLHTASTITPAEIGMLRARVCVGVASATVYVDPYIRVA